MPFRLLLGILLCAAGVLAQPVSFTATAAFDAPAAVGSGANTVTASFVSVGRQTINPTATGFDFARLIQLRLDVAGDLNAVQFPETFVRPFTLAIQPENSPRGATLRGTLRLGFSFPRRFLAVELDPGSASADGVTYSWFGTSRELLDFSLPSPPVALFDLQGRATRATITFQPPSLRITANAGEFAIQSVSVTTLPGAQLSATAPNGFVSPLIESVNSIRIQVLHNLQEAATSSVLVPVTGSGLPVVFLPVELSLQPGNRILSVNPRELRFVYTRGQPQPPNQQSTVVSSDPVIVQPNSWDTTWLTPTLSQGFVTISPIVANKNTGAHRTHVILQNSSGLRANLYSNFYVNDGPGALALVSQPSNGGVVLSNAGVNPANGTRVDLSAVASPGFVFGRWSGAVNTTANPINIVVNGPTAVSALFLPATGSCTYTLRPPSVRISRDGGYGKVDVQSQPGCGWTVSDLPPWMQLTTAGSGNGSGSFTFTVQSNSAGLSAAQRDAFVRVGDRILMVEQAASLCSPFSASIPGIQLSNGGNPSVLVTSPDGCPYAPTPTQLWINVPAADGPQLMGQQFRVTVQPNLTGQPRTGAVELAGYRVPLLQRAAIPSSPYADIVTDNPFADHVTILKTNNSVVTCAPDLYCPNAPVLRSDMAEMLVRALAGDSFSFGLIPLFLDVPSTHPQFRWIQKLAELGITNGCAAQRFCPGETMTRGQMAAFLVRAKTGIPAGVVPSGSAINPFVDVAETNLFAAHIRQLRVLGITTGCYDNAFCPDDAVTRGQLAAFLVRAFFTP
ncbi:MAG: S-layer homology domain-containing protein [Bryobacterales bacterium]|nr:S-layer homology domain-containing protein [Bryobacterales bacterium]